MANRIKELMKQRGLSRDAVADALDTHPVTVSKLISGRMKLTTEWMERFAAVLKVQPADLLSDAPTNMRRVKVRGRVEAGAWEEAFEWPEDDWYEVAIPDDPALRGEDLFGGVTHGPSMNRRYPEGSVLIFVSTQRRGEQLRVGKRYLVERERADGLREATVKRVWRDDAGALWLIPESDDPRYQEPISIGGVTEDQTVRIVGRVVYSVQRED